MILHDDDERLTLNMRHDTSSYLNQPQKESINMINICDDSYEDYVEDLFATNHLSGNPTFSSHIDLTSPKVINLSGSTTSSSSNHLLEEFTDELALITFPPGNDDLPFDIESDLREIEYLLNHDPTKEMDSILEDSVDECNLVDPNNNLVDTILEMFIEEHTLDYSSPPLYDDYDDDLFELEFNNDGAYNDPFDSKGDKIKESKILIDELDPLRSSDFLPSPEYDSFLFEDFSKVDTLPSTDNEDKVFNPEILIHENLYEVTVQVIPDKNVNKIFISNASLILEDFDPPLYKLTFHKEVPRLGWTVYITFLAKITESLRDMIGYEYGLSSLDGWTNYHSSIRCASFKALYGRKCRPLVLWVEIRESKMIGPELRKPLEFEIGDQVLLKASPWKGMIRFGKKGKLASRYVGPFEILERIGPVAYRLRLPEELSSVHDTFHVLNLKKCLADANLHVPLHEIKIEKTLCFVEEPVEIMDRERKPLEFEIGDQVLLKASPWKGMIRFGKKGKLASRYVGPFEILERIGPIAYRLRLPEELSSVHDTFHVLNLKKCLADANLHVPLDEIKIEKTLCFVEEPVEIMDREVKSLKRSKIPIVKVCLNSKHGLKFTWEIKDCVLFEKFCHWTRDFGKDFDESMIEPYMSKKTPNGFDDGRWWKYAIDMTYLRTIFDGVNDTSIEKFDNLFFNDFFHVWVKSTLSLNDGFFVVLKVDFVFAKRWANARNIGCFPSKRFSVLLEKGHKMFLLTVFEYSGYDYWKMRMIASVVCRNGLPKMRGNLPSSFICRIRKSTRNTNFPTWTSIFSATPIGYCEYGIKLMLDPRSAKAKHSTEFAKALRVRNLWFIRLERWWIEFSLFGKRRIYFLFGFVNLIFTIIVDDGGFGIRVDRWIICVTTSCKYGIHMLILSGWWSV
nr:putative reverse transcriptase domain-containing protein [Tanacetum cinerariifolium]